MTNNSDGLALEAHLRDFERRLQRVTACTQNGRHGCSARWIAVEQAWRRQARQAEKERITQHSKAVGQFLPSSSATFNNRRWKPLDHWAPDFSCGKDARRFPEHADIVGGAKSAQPDDGAKWLCGAVTFTRPCTVLSVGSNFADSFERALSSSANCTSYVLDPTLGMPRAASVQNFSRKLAQYGATLNASIGLGNGQIKARDGSGPYRLVSFREILQGSRELFCDSTKCGKWHISLAKIDAEGGEWAGLTDPQDGVWRLLKNEGYTCEHHPFRVFWCLGLRSHASP
ncbi:hypothetical protein AB1Y20_000250 [Prymnesium parvum]|uniref:Methyltransferase domain-containing protein n=1 Tax=Prymnesium parvum TaxID=97485 RepID=A0AB34K4T4_PRYPA